MQQYFLIDLAYCDIAFPNIDWFSHTVNASDNSLSAQFYFATQDAYMTQHVFKPTRHRGGQAGIFSA